MRVGKIETKGKFPNRVVGVMGEGRNSEILFGCTVSFLMTNN